MTDAGPAVDAGGWPVGPACGPAGGGLPLDGCPLGGWSSGLGAAPNSAFPLLDLV